MSTTISPFTVYLAEHYGEVKRLAVVLGRRKAKLRLLAAFWTLPEEERERLARISEDPGSHDILSDALKDINGLGSEEESYVSQYVDEASIAGVVVRTDFSNDEAWRSFVETLLRAEMELATPVDEEASSHVGTSGVASLGEQDDADSDSDSEEVTSPGRSSPRSPSPTSLFAFLSPPDSSPLRVRLMGASNLVVLRLVNEVDAVRTRRPPPGTQRSMVISSGHRLVDYHGFAEAYSGPLVWVYDSRSNTDGSARAVCQCTDGVGSATADSWRARASFLPELQLHLVSGMKIDFGGLDRWDHVERQRNIAEADYIVS